MSPDSKTERNTRRSVLGSLVPFGQDRLRRRTWIHRCSIPVHMTNREGLPDPLFMKNFQEE